MFLNVDSFNHCPNVLTGCHDNRKAYVFERYIQIRHDVDEILCLKHMFFYTNGLIYYFQFIRPNILLEKLHNVFKVSNPLIKYC